MAGGESSFEEPSSTVTTEERRSAGRTLVVMTADGGSDPLFDFVQPPDPESEVRRFLRAHGAGLRPLTRQTGTAVPLNFTDGGTPQLPPLPSPLGRFFIVDARDDRLDGLAEDLRTLASVEAAYIKPAAEPAALNAMQPTGPTAPATPDFESRQGHLDPAPGGVDARHAWSKPGGDGAGVRVVDVEGAWRLTHEELNGSVQLAAGVPADDAAWRNHGTAVVGTIGARKDGRGVTGIAPGATIRTVSIFDELGSANSAGAIAAAADLLSPGDVLLLELHRPGPRHEFASRPDQQGYIPIEWWPDDFAAIRMATQKGIVVVEAGGNGGENLDDPFYDEPAAGFPSGWGNPLRRAGCDSGAILVGAGAPPPGTHGNDWGPDRSRLDFSNHGSAMDVQGWGREVTTCGYGDLQGGGEDVWYTDQFAGTSSASPVVVGVLACVQGMLRAQAKPVLTPAQARAALRNTGSPQQASGTAPLAQRIGSRPDLRQLAAHVGIDAPVAPPPPSPAGPAPVVGDGHIGRFALDDGAPVQTVFSLRPSLAGSLIATVTVHNDGPQDISILEDGTRDDGIVVAAGNSATIVASGSVHLRCAARSAGVPARSSGYYAVSVSDGGGSSAKTKRRRRK